MKLTYLVSLEKQNIICDLFYKRISVADRKAVVSKGKLRCCGSSLFLKNKFGIGYHLTLVLEGIPKYRSLIIVSKVIHELFAGACKEHAITRLVTTHVPKAEKARRHGRELSFILPHNAVENFAPLFSAIEQEINNRTTRLGGQFETCFLFHAFMIILW